MLWARQPLTASLRLSSILARSVTMSSPTKQGKLDAFMKGNTSSGSKKTDSNSIKNGQSSSSGSNKRPRADGTDIPPEAKRPKAKGTHQAFPNGAPDPPEVIDEMQSVLAKLQEVHGKAPDVQHTDGGAVLFWMRMKDLRLKDNKALSKASDFAQKHNKALVILHVLSPGDCKAHDRAPIRIDFVLRNLANLQQELDTLNVPLAIRTFTKRKTIPQEVLSLAKQWKVSHIFANLEYEVDELRRDVDLCERAQDPSTNIQITLEHDYVLAVPGKVLKPAGNTPYAVFSPFHRAWSALLVKDLDLYSKEYAYPAGNSDFVRSDPVLGPLFEDKVPNSVDGFEMESEEHKETARKLYLVGTDVAEKILHRFMQYKPGKGSFANPPLDDENTVEDPDHARVAMYSDGRSLPSNDGTSRLSPYLAAGIISIRACLRALLERNNGKLPITRETGAGSWAQELCFRDFYQHVMVHWPRVSMGRNFVLKYEAVQWDDDPNGERLKAWTEGRTGFPFIDAGMRQMREQGWMHNRARMAVASFLVKDLMLNWKEGERIFSRYLIDGDLGSNNAGWQWTASTGTDPQPYFRIFNPTNQGEKHDPDGDYIRRFVPELRNVKGKAIYEPHKHLKISELKATGYPKPIVDHAKARKKAIARFKNPGTTADE